MLRSRAPIARATTIARTKTDINIIFNYVIQVELKKVSKTTNKSDIIIILLFILYTSSAGRLTKDYWIEFSQLEALNH